MKLISIFLTLAFVSFAFAQPPLGLGKKESPPISSKSVAEDFIGKTIKIGDKDIFFGKTRVEKLDVTLLEITPYVIHKGPGKITPGMKVKVGVIAELC